jgi:hypothetical protein
MTHPVIMTTTVIRAINLTVSNLLFLHPGDQEESVIHQIGFNTSRSLQRRKHDHGAKRCRQSKKIATQRK